MLQILGVGLPRTGTASLTNALKLLGYNAEHHAPHRLPLDGLHANSFKVFDDVDAVIDAPACHFFEEIGNVYSDLTYILTVRNEDAWWRSIKLHSDKIITGGASTHIDYTRRLHGLIFDYPVPQEYLYRRAFRRHNQAVRTAIPPHRLLEIDVTTGGGWLKLCEWLHKGVPEQPFPWENRTAS